MVSLGAALALVPGSALAAGETIAITQDSAATAGVATSFTASGALNAADTMFGFTLYLFVKDPSRDPTCAATQGQEATNSTSAGTAELWITPTGAQIGSGPSYSYPFKATFNAGRFLVCGYVIDDFNNTMAATQIGGIVAAAPTTPSTTTTTGTPAPTGTTPKATAAPRKSKPKARSAPKATVKDHKLRCSAGTWSGSPTKRSYAWYRQGTTKKLGTRSTLSVTKSIKGRKVVCKVTASNSAGSTTAASKAVTAK